MKPQYPMSKRIAHWKPTFLFSEGAIDVYHAERDVDDHIIGLQQGEDSWWFHSIDCMKGVLLGDLISKLDPADMAAVRLRARAYLNIIS